MKEKCCVNESGSMISFSEKGFTFLDSTGSVGVRNLGLRLTADGSTDEFQAEKCKSLKEGFS